MRTVRSKTLANAMDQKTRSNRALGKQNREQLSEESRFQKSREIAENLMAMAVWKQAKQVLLYASYGSEVSTGLLIDAALAAGKEVFLPKVLGDQMEFFRITDRAELAPGYQHILEPPGQTKRFLPDASIPTLLTAPGLAFDRSGRTPDACRYRKIHQKAPFGLISDFSSRSLPEKPFPCCGEVLFLSFLF